MSGRVRVPSGFEWQLRVVILAVQFGAVEVVQAGIADRPLSDEV